MKCTLPPEACRLLCRHARVFLPTFVDEFNRSVRATSPGDCRNGFDDLAQLLFALAHSFFGPQTVTDVPGYHQQELTTTIQDAAGVYFDRKHCPILSPMPVCVEHGLARRRPLGDYFHFLLIGIRVEGTRRLPDDFLAAVTKAFAGLAIHINNDPLLEIVDEEGVPRVVHKGPEAGFTLAKRFFGTLALRDVVAGHQDCHRRTALISFERPAGGRDYLHSVLLALRQLAFPAAATK